MTTKAVPGFLHYLCPASRGLTNQIINLTEWRMMSCQTSGMRTLKAIAFTNFALRNGALCGLFLTQTTDRFRFSFLLSLKEWSSQNVRQASGKTREGGLSENRTGLEQNEPFRTEKTSSKSAVSFQEDHCVVSRDNPRVKQGNSTTNWRAECKNAGANCAKVNFYNQDSFKWESCLSWWTLQRIKDKGCYH